MVCGGDGVDVAVVGSGNNVYVVDSGEVIVVLIIVGDYAVSAASDVVAVVEDYIVIVERRC
jgi:hypothetical protein